MGKFLEQLGSKRIVLVAGALAAAVTLGGMSTPVEAQVDDYQNKCVDREEPGVFFDYDADGSIDDYNCVPLPGCVAHTALHSALDNNLTQEQIEAVGRARVVYCLGDPQVPDFLDFYAANPWADALLRPDTPTTIAGKTLGQAISSYDNPRGWLRRYMELNGIGPGGPDSSTEETLPVDEQQASDTATTTVPAVEPVDSQPETATGTTEETLPVDEQQASDTATTTVPAVEPVDSQPETATGTTEETLPVDEQQASDTATTTVPAVEPVDSQPELPPALLKRLAG